jgi:hypothetical protein
MAGSFDKDGVFPASQFVTVGDEHWIYYGGSSERHYSIGRDMRIGLAKIRLDGFIALEAGEEPGQVVTKPFRVDGDRLEVNIDARQGQLRMEILDEQGKPIPGYTLEDSRDQTTVDSVRFEPTWKNRASLAPLKGKTVSLRFVLRNARLYAFQIR